MLIIFDCDGVVIDSMRLSRRWNPKPISPSASTCRRRSSALRFSGVGDFEVYRILSQETGRAIPPDIAAQIERRKKEVFRQRLKPVDGIREALTAIDTTPRCIASGTGVDLLFYSLANCGALRPVCSSHLLSRNGPGGKPFPDLFLHAANEMGHAPETCLVIEDGIAGVQSGRAAGMRVFGFIGGSHCDDEHADRLKAAAPSLFFRICVICPPLSNSSTG